MTFLSNVQQEAVPVCLEMTRRLRCRDVDVIWSTSSGFVTVYGPVCIYLVFQISFLLILISRLLLLLLSLH